MRHRAFRTQRGQHSLIDEARGAAGRAVFGCIFDRALGFAWLSSARGAYFEGGGGAAGNGFALAVLIRQLSSMEPLTCNTGRNSA